MSLNSKLWKWLGVEEQGDLTTDLNLCFKWLVPKLNTVSLRIGRLATDAFVEKDGIEGWYTGKEPSPLTLCLAIEKLIDKGGK